MFDEFATDDLLGISDALEALRDLESNSHQAFVAQRASERVEIHARLVVRPGNASQRYASSVEGVTADVSNGGCMALLSRPVMPGDFFFFLFDDSEIQLGSLAARCLRCRMVREDTFEVGFKFMSPVDIQSAIASS